MLQKDCLFWVMKISSCAHDQNMRAASGFNVVPSYVTATHREVALRRGVFSSSITPCLHSASPPGYRLTIYGTLAGDLPAEPLKHGWCGYHDVSPVPSDVYGTLRVQAHCFRLWWLIICLNLTGLRAAQSTSKILFLGVSVRTHGNVRVSLEGICTWIRRLNEDRPHHCGWDVIFSPLHSQGSLTCCFS